MSSGGVMGTTFISTIQNVRGSAMQVRLGSN
jgi:hypothetical protein